MKMIMVFLAIMATTFGRPQSTNDAVVTKYENDNIGVDGYKFAYETSDGVSRSEQGEIKNLGTDSEAIVVRGTISWVDKDGQQFTLNFVADENGFQPEGAHLPKK